MQKSVFDETYSSDFRQLAPHKNNPMTSSLSVPRLDPSMHIRVPPAIPTSFGVILVISGGGGEPSCTSLVLLARLGGVTVRLKWLPMDISSKFRLPRSLTDLEFRLARRDRGALRLFSGGVATWVLGVFPRQQRRFAQNLSQGPAEFWRLQSLHGRRASLGDPRLVQQMTLWCMTFLVRLENRMRVSPSDHFAKTIRTFSS